MYLAAIPSILITPPLPPPLPRFYAKTLNSWTERSPFTKHAGKYDLLAMDYEPKVWISSNMEAGSMASCDHGGRRHMTTASSDVVSWRQVCHWPPSLPPGPLGFDALSLLPPSLPSLLSPSSSLASLHSPPSLSLPLPPPPPPPPPLSSSL